MILRRRRCGTGHERNVCAKNGFTKMALEHEQIAQMLERQQEPQTK
jgi:hypothetical protein